MNSDEQLVKKSLQGDNGAFEELVVKYQNKIYALSYRYKSPSFLFYLFLYFYFPLLFRSLPAVLNK